MALWRTSEIEDKRSDLTIEKQYVLHGTFESAHSVPNSSHALGVIRRELEKATTRTHNREKPYSAKAARKTLYERVSDSHVAYEQRVGECVCLRPRVCRSSSSGLLAA
jgi:hypothetical protein